MSDKTRVVIPVDREIVLEMIDARLQSIEDQLRRIYNEQRVDGPLDANQLANVLWHILRTRP